jgi:uncharacterized protein (DUF3820 family)
MPFGKYKGVRVRLLPDAYLSFLTTLPFLAKPCWLWLRSSVVAELHARGLRGDLADVPDPFPPPPLLEVETRRAIDLE